jgi:hypothetical protein
MKLIIGMWAYVVFNCVSFTCEMDSDLTVNQVLRQFCVTPSTPQYSLGASQKLGPRQSQCVGRQETQVE